MISATCTCESYALLLLLPSLLFFQKNNMFKIENNKYINRWFFMMKIPFIKLMKMDMYICYILSYQKM